MSKKKKLSYKRYSNSLELAKLEYEVRGLEMENEDAEIHHANNMNSETRLGIFRLYGDIDPPNIERLRLQTGRYATGYPDAPITLIISSGGGYAVDGWILFDHLRALSTEGHKITTIVRGFAASMAAVLAQAGDVRIIGPESYLLIHEASGEAEGSGSQMKEQADTIRQITRQTERVFARRSKLSAKEIKKRSHKMDWLINAKEAKALGLADKVG